MAVDGETEGREDRRPEVEDERGLLRAETEIEQSMMQMLGVRGGDRASPHPASQNRPTCVENRDGQGRDRHHQGQDDRALRHGQYGEGGQGETEKVATRIAHEDARRMPVEEEKAYTSPNQGAGQDDDIHLPAIDRRQQKGGRHDGDDARRQAIDPIDQVDRVLQPNEPEEGERDRYRHRQVDDVPAEETHGMNVDTEDDDRQQGGGDLKEELGEGSDPVEVIENHQGGDDGRRKEQP